MLVLTRKQGERIRLKVGDEIVWITIFSAECGKARVGIDAGPHVLVHREEIVEAIDREERVEQLHGAQG